MTNKEKYANEIKRYGWAKGNWCKEFVLPIILHKEKCIEWKHNRWNVDSCELCHVEQKRWMETEIDE